MIDKDLKYIICTRKLKFTSKKRAKKYANNFARKYNAEKLREYKCQICNQWHLTKKKKQINN